jgi:DUF4097 and DUF4098 domain-containing protein YvlB
MKILTRFAIVVLAAGTAGPAMAQDVRIEIPRNITWLGLDAAGSLQNRDFRSEKTERETRKLQIGATGTLEIKNVSGEIVVTAGSGRETTVEIVRVSRGRTDADAELGLKEVTVEVDERADRATVATHYPDDRNRRSSYNVTVSYTVTAPAGTHLTAGNVGGDVKVTGIRGDLTANTVGGNVTIADAGRVIAAKTVGGTVSVNGASTDDTLEAASVGGNVSLQHVKARRVSMSSVGGNLTAADLTCDAADLGTMSGTVEFSGPLSRAGRYELHAQSGTVRFTPTGGTGFDLQARTFSGNIQADSAIQIRQSDAGRGPHHSVRGTFGDGSAVVILTTFSGDVIVARK